MPPGVEPFNLDQTLISFGQALRAVVCHVWFDAALHGLLMALLLGLAGFVLYKRRTRFGKPLMAVCRRLSLFCLVLMLPGGLALATSGQLPPTGVFHISSLGFLAFWSLICLHLSAEEMNFQWF